MRNERVRFAIDDDGSIYDYKTGQNHPPSGVLEDEGHVFDLSEVKHCIENNKHTHTAHSVLVLNVVEPAPTGAPESTSDHQGDPQGEQPPADPNASDRAAPEVKE